jgi:signal transduction histidine kinase
METVLYRVIQEALANVIVHSGADRVTVELAILPAEVTARVTDNGHGFDVAKTLAGDRQPFGLLGIRERVASVSGSVNITSDARQGTVIEVRIPNPKEATNPKEGPAPKEATRNGG